MIWSHEAEQLHRLHNVLHHMGGGVRCVVLKAGNPTAVAAAVVATITSTTADPGAGPDPCAHEHTAPARPGVVGAANVGQGVVPNAHKLPVNVNISSLCSSSPLPCICIGVTIAGIRAVAITAAITATAATAG